jgi:hypothetical protein
MLNCRGFLGSFFMTNVVGRVARNEGTTDLERIKPIVAQWSTSSPLEQTLLFDGQRSNTTTRQRGHIWKMKLRSILFIRQSFLAFPLAWNHGDGFERYSRRGITASCNAEGREG